MIKKLLSSAFVFSIVLTGCIQTNDNLDFGGLPTNSSISSVSTNGDDWYERLSPSVQSYYAEAKGKNGQELFVALNKIISRNSKVEGYDDSRNYMYSTADNVGGSKPGIMALYSQVFIPGTSGNGDLYKESGDQNNDGVSGDFINCEHVWPQSFFDKKLPMVADIHHLQSTLSRPNNRRDNLPFGEVAGQIKYQTSSGSKLGMSKAGGLEFEPTDVAKGNIARSMFYFYLRYYDKGVKGGAYNESRHWDSKVGMFTKWSMEVDKVNEQDIRRNDLIFAKQGNRNPFVDVPELPALIGEAVLQKM